MAPVLFARPAALFVIAALTSGCRDSKPDPDAAMTSCIPASAVVVAGLNLDTIRAAPVYAKLPPVVLALTEPFRQAQKVVLVYDGRNLLAISRGVFREAPAGATLVAPGLAIAGSPDLERAATSQYSMGTSGAPELVGPRNKPVWIAVRGNVTLPLSGNAANLNRLLHETERITITAELGDRIDWEVVALCRTPEAGREFEQSLRAILTLTATANARQPDMAGLLRAIEINREGRTVRVTLKTAPEGLDQLLRAW